MEATERTLLENSDIKYAYKLHTSLDEPPFPNNWSINQVLKRTRSILFLQAFTLYFGSYPQLPTIEDTKSNIYFEEAKKDPSCSHDIPDDLVNKTHAVNLKEIQSKRAALDNTLEIEMSCANSLSEDEKYMSPKAYEDYFKTKYALPSCCPLPVFPPHGTPREKFLWNLQYDCVGKFLWLGGRSDAFTQWITGKGHGNIPPYSRINCWEAAFHAAIRADFINIDTILPIYNGSINKQIKELKATGKSDDAAHAEHLQARGVAEILYSALNKLSLDLKSCGVQASTLDKAMNLVPGDLLLIPSYNLKGEVDQIIEHLAVVIQQVPAMPSLETGEMQAKYTKIVHLWGISGGATTCVASLSNMLCRFNNGGRFSSVSIQPQTEAEHVKSIQDETDDATITALLNSLQNTE